MNTNVGKFWETGKPGILWSIGVMKSRTQFSNPRTSLLLKNFYQRNTVVSTQHQLQPSMSNGTMNTVQSRKYVELPPFLSGENASKYSYQLYFKCLPHLWISLSEVLPSLKPPLPKWPYSSVSPIQTISSGCLLLGILPEIPSISCHSLLQAWPEDQRCSGIDKHLHI